jgi:hypothetical protein
MCDIETSRMRSPWTELRRSATGKRKIHLYLKRNELSVKPVLPVTGYFDCAKEMSMAVSDKPDGGY